MTTSSPSPNTRKTAWAIVAGVLVGAGLGVGAHILVPAPLGSEAADSLADAPHPTPSPSNVGLLAELDWHRPTGTVPMVTGWYPDADPGWPGVALDAGDLWALESVFSDGDTALYLVGPGGRRLGLMALPGSVSVVGWDHDAGLAYATGNDGPIVIDLAICQWAPLPLLPEWDDGSEYGVGIYSIGTTTSGEAIWRIYSGGEWVGVWYPVDGWDVIQAGVGTDGWTIGPGVPSDWMAGVDYQADKVTVTNIVTHDTVVLPGGLSTWDTGEMEFNLIWIDGDSIARPPSGSEGWMAFDAPAFDTGRPMDSGDFPIYRQAGFSTAQYPGTPLVATFASDYNYWERTVASLGVLTTDGYREIVDLTAEDAAPLLAYSIPTEVRSGVYLFTYWEGQLLVVDINAGKAYDYGITADYPADGSAYVNVSHVVYVAPAEDNAGGHI